MSSIMIRELARGSELDREAMSAVRGGTNPWLAGLGPVANVNVDVSQIINQKQAVDVNVLNNVGVIGAGFGPLALTVSPSQFASAGIQF